MTNREMKDSGVEWIGEIPKEWDVVHLGRIGNFSASGIDKKINKNEEIVKIVNYVDVYRNNKMIIDDAIDFMEVTTTPNRKEQNLLKKGDIIFTPSSETIEEIGRSAVVYENIDNLSFSYHVLRFHPNIQLDLSFKKYMANNHFLYNYFSSRAVGTVRKTLNRNDFNTAPVILPPYDEQQKIAAFLDGKVAHINNIIEDTKKSIENLKAYKQSLITETVTKGLDPNIEMKDSGIEWIGDIPNNWSVIPLKYISSLNDENLSNKTSEDYSFKYVDIGSVSFENGIEQMEETNFKSSPSRARRIVRKNDIIISTVRTYLKAIALIQECNDIIVSTGFAVVRPKNYLVDPLFLSYSLKSDYFTEKVRAYSYGIAYPSINSTEIATMEIVLPPKSIQIEIACFLRDRIFQIDSLINEKDKLITKLESYKKSLIYEYVTGKKEVK